MASKSKSKLTAVDLFAGAGGATEGLRRAGIAVVAAVELDKDASMSYRLNHPRVRLYESDIRDIDAAGVRDQLGLVRGELDILKACPPCQGFSTLGKEDPSDPRNDLTTEVWRFVKEFLPKAFVLENVPGIKGDYRLERLISQATEIGYIVRTFDVNAANLGVPQRRLRYIVFGVRGHRAGSRLMKLNEVKSIYARTTAGSALKNVASKVKVDDPLNRHRASNAKTLERIRAVPVGGNRFDLPDHLVLPCHAKMKGRSAGGPYGRIILDAPAPTMTTRCTTPSCGSFIHPSEDRGITLREAAVLQTFPLNYRFAGGYNSIEKQIGNAVPVKMATTLGEVIRSVLEKRS